MIVGLHDADKNKFHKHYATATNRDSLFEMMYQDLLVANSILHAADDVLTDIIKIANEVATEKGWEKLVSDK